MPALGNSGTLSNPERMAASRPDRTFVRIATNGCFRVLGPRSRTTELVKGFGCRQAYESLKCRNPRSARVELWGFVFRGVPTVAANCLIRCAGLIDEAACWRGRRACRSDSNGVCLPNRWRHNNVHMRYRWPAPAWRGCACKWAIPGHEAVSRFVAAMSGGPRGCLLRSGNCRHAFASAGDLRSRLRHEGDKERSYIQDEIDEIESILCQMCC